jgi:hypothetical protein
MLEYLIVIVDVKCAFLDTVNRSLDSISCIDLQQYRLSVRWIYQGTSDVLLIRLQFRRRVMPASVNFAHPEATSLLFPGEVAQVLSQYPQVNPSQIYKTLPLLLQPSILNRNGGSLLTASLRLKLEHNRNLLRTRS